MTAAEDTTEKDAAFKPCACITLDDGGKIVLELFPEEAPLAVERFMTLVKAGFYDGLRFHRVESYLIQTGKYENEYPPITGEMFEQDLRHEPGVVGMARLQTNYDSATTQFYIMKEDKPEFNGEYTIFARVIGGMDVVNAVEKHQKIQSIKLME